jgi:hypothetical protein
MERGSSDYELHPTDKLIDESDVLAHQALSRILELIREAEEKNDSTK